MDIREVLYCLRQYRQYNIAGVVPDVTCDECDENYYPRVNDDEVYLWCWSCDREVDPGWGTITAMVREVKRIERQN